MREINIPENYQLAEAGLIPCEWQAKKLGELFKFKNGVNAEKKQYGKGIKFINVLEVIQKNSLLYDDIPGFISLDPESIKSNIVQKGDVIFNRTSETQEEIGLTAVYLDEQEVVFGGFVIRAKPINDLIDCYFCKYGFSSLTVRNQIIKRGQGAIRANIGQSDLKEVFIPLPPLPEQKAIALSLSDTDALITECDRLITKKRHIKQGTMQQLLTGKKRLLGFGEEQGYKQTEIGMIPDDWNVLEIADIVEDNRVPSGTYKEKNLYGKGTKIIKLSDVFSLDYFDPAKAKRVVLNSNELLSYRVRVGDIFIALASVKLEGVGKVMLVTELDEDTAYDHNVALIRANELIDAKFLFYLLKSNLVRREISKLSTQVGTTFLKSSTILKFQLPIPAVKEEQASIATVLSDMDAEIAALEQKRDKYKALKQGMMQELLTGKTRLKNNSAD